MEEQLISFDTAKLAKEKGYFESPNKCYDPKCLDINHIYDWWTERFYSTPERIQRLLLAPTQSLLQKWLREVHKIEVFVKVFYSPQLNREGSFMYWGMYSTKNCIGDCDKSTECKYKYEDAFEEALVLALNKITV